MRYSGCVKTCNKCNVEQPLDEFGEYKGRLGTLRRNSCHSCRKRAEKIRYATDPNVKDRMKKRARDYRLKTQYGIDEKEFQRMVESQNFKCAICRCVPDSKRKFNVDHCHTTGKVRGLLCWNCNIALGYLKENVDSFKNAIDYLQK